MFNFSRYPHNYVQRTQRFDFFNYAGIHRPVYLIALPRVHIADISLKTSFSFRSSEYISTYWLCNLAVHSSPPLLCRNPKQHYWSSYLSSESFFIKGCCEMQNNNIWQGRGISCKKQRLQWTSWHSRCYFVVASRYEWKPWLPIHIKSK